MSTEDVTVEIAAVLHGAGLTDKPVEFDGDMHSWRCGYPDQYGPCDCFESLVSDLADLIAARDRRVRAEAWDEGYGRDEECGVPRANPYREADA